MIIVFVSSLSQGLGESRWHNGAHIWARSTLTMCPLVVIIGICPLPDWFLFSLLCNICNPIKMLTIPSPLWVFPTNTTCLNFVLSRGSLNIKLVYYDACWFPWKHLLLFYLKDHKAENIAETSRPDWGNVGRTRQCWQVSVETVDPEGNSSSLSWGCFMLGQTCWCAPWATWIGGEDMTDGIREHQRELGSLRMSGWFKAFSAWMQSVNIHSNYQGYREQCKL